MVCLSRRCIDNPNRKIGMTWIYKILWLTYEQIDFQDKPNSYNISKLEYENVTDKLQINPWKRYAQN